MVIRFIVIVKMVVFIEVFVLVVVFFVVLGGNLDLFLFKVKVLCDKVVGW